MAIPQDRNTREAIKFQEASPGEAAVKSVMLADRSVVLDIESATGFTAMNARRTRYGSMLLSNF